MKKTPSQKSVQKKQVNNINKSNAAFRSSALGTLETQLPSHDDCGRRRGKRGHLCVHVKIWWCLSRGGKGSGQGGVCHWRLPLNVAAHKNSTKIKTFFFNKFVVRVSVVVVVILLLFLPLLLLLFVYRRSLVILIIVHMTLFNTVRCTIMRSPFVSNFFMRCCRLCLSLVTFEPYLNYGP